MWKYGPMGQMIEIDGAGVAAYVAQPAEQARAGLLVIHEIWGLVDHIKDVADRFAEQGYLALAPDLLTGVGISPDVGRSCSG